MLTCFLVSSIFLPCWFQVDGRNEMVVVSQEAAAKMVQENAFLVHQTVLGNTYGIERAAVKRVQAAGKVCRADELVRNWI